MTKYSNLLNKKLKDLLFLLIISTFLFPSPTMAQTISSFSRMEYIMGTLFTIEVYSPSTTQAERALDEAFKVIRHYDQVLSHYKANNELARVLKTAHLHPTPISPTLYQSIEEALLLSQRTNGYFDITIAPLITLWGFKDKVFKKPDDSMIEETLKQIGYQWIELAHSPPTLFLKKPGITLDFGAIGKGQAIDKAAKVLKQEGIQSAHIDSRSTQYFLGKPPGKSSWEITIQHPRKSATLTTLQLVNQAVSTSGDDQQFFIEKGIRYSHIINPKTGDPIPSHRLSATIVSPQATTSDVLATTCLLLNNNQIKTLLKQFPETYGIRLVKQSGVIQIENYSN